MITFRATFIYVHSKFIGRFALAGVFKLRLSLITQAITFHAVVVFSTVLTIVLKFAFCSQHLVVMKA